MYYRKYRSQTIAEVDNSEIRETLGKSLLENKFSQAYLLVGTRGSGKTSMARLIAKVVNCTGRKLGEEPCNKCESCQAIMEGRSLDVIEIDAASNTGVDDIRDLREKVKLAPVQGKFKIYIIDEVHMLSTSAFNALLKTLEEPPEHVIFVLATTDPQKLPETIVSRCLVYDFKTASKEELVRSLSRVVSGEKIKVEKGVLEKIADLGRGSFRDAQKILEQLAMATGEVSLKTVSLVGSESSRDVALILLGAVSEGDDKKILETVEKYTLGGGGVESLVEEILRVLQEYLLVKVGINKTEFSFSFSETQVRNLVSGLIVAMTSVRDCPVPQLPLEAMLLEYFSGKDKGGVTPLEVLVGVKDETVEKVKPSEDHFITNDRPTVRDQDEKKEDKKETVSEPVRVNQESATQSEISIQAVMEKWPEILVDLKPHNHSLVAFLRACRPKEVVGETLVIEVFYKFHRDKLSEQRTREIFEQVVSNTLGTKVRAKFELSEKKPE
jgi:DNA polymerase-3 subunit gamma/tau